MGNKFFYIGIIIMVLGLITTKVVWWYGLLLLYFGIFICAKPLIIGYFTHTKNEVEE